MDKTKIIWKQTTKWCTSTSKASRPLERFSFCGAATGTQPVGHHGVYHQQWPWVLHDLKFATRSELPRSELSIVWYRLSCQIQTTCNLLYAVNKHMSFWSGNNSDATAQVEAKLVAENFTSTPTDALPLQMETSDTEQWKETNIPSNPAFYISWVVKSHLMPQFRSIFLDIIALATTQLTLANRQAWWFFRPHTFQVNVMQRPRHWASGQTKGCNFGLLILQNWCVLERPTSKEEPLASGSQ